MLCQFLLYNSDPVISVCVCVCMCVCVCVYVCVYLYILFLILSSIMFYIERLDIVPCAGQ